MMMRSMYPQSFSQTQPTMLYIPSGTHEGDVCASTSSLRTSRHAIRRAACFSRLDVPAGPYYCDESQCVKHTFDCVVPQIGPFVCILPGCLYNCKRRDVFVNHLQLHAVQGKGLMKVHACSICGWLTIQSSNLKNHMPTHTGIRSNVCPYPGCGKSYKDASAFSRHRKTHQHIPDINASPGRHGWSRMSKAELIASRIAKAQQLGQDLPLLASCSDGHMVDDTILSGVLAPIFVTMPSPSQDMVNGQPVSEVVPSAYQEPHSANYFYTEHPLTTHGPTGYAPEQTNAGIDTVAEPDVLFTTSSTVSGSFQYPPGLSSSISFNATSTPGSTCPPTSQYHSADHLYGQVIQSTSQSHMSPGLCPLEYSADYADTIAFDEVADLSLCGYPEMSSGDFYDQQPQRSSSTGSHVQNELLYGYPVLAETTNFASTAQQNYFHDPTPPFHLAQCNNNAQEFEAQIYTSSYC